MKKKRIVIGVSVLLAGVLGVTGFAGYLTFVRGPVNPPADACTTASKPARGPVVVAAGASMTQGRLGADWVASLRERPEYDGYDFVNAGINGNTSEDLRKRVERDIVACDPDMVTLLIGTNDVRDDVPLDQYRNNLAAIVDRIHDETDARIALMSLPPLGEDLDAEINDKLSRYNAAIKETATRAEVSYIPVHEAMADVLTRRGGEGAAYDFSFTTAYSAGAKHHMFGRSWDEVARSNNLELLVDHVHLSDKGGAMVTDLAADWLSRFWA